MGEGCWVGSGDGGMGWFKCMGLDQVGGWRG